MTPIEDLQATWCRLTGQELNRKALERMFFDFLNAAFTADDLRCVVVNMQASNKRMTGAAFSFRVHRVIGDLEWFASMLGEARAMERNRIKPVTPRNEVLSQWRPEVGEAVKDNVVPMVEALRRAVNENL